MQSPYVVKSEFFMFDVIKTNLGKRPVHFSPGIPPNGIAFFNDYLIISGLTRRFVPKNLGKRAVDLAFSKTVIEQQMNFVLPSPEDRYKGEYKTLAAQVGMMFFQVAAEMQKNNQKDSIATFITYMHQKLPFDKFQYNQYHLYFHQMCILIQKPELAKAHLRAYGNELTQTINRLEADPRLSPEEKSQIIQGLKIHIKTLVSTAKADKLEDVVLELENKFTKYLL